MFEKVNINTIAENIDKQEGNIKNSGWLGKQEVINFIYNPEYDLNIEEKNLIISVWNENWINFGQKGIPILKFTKYLKQAIGRKTSTETKKIKREINNVSNTNKTQGENSSIKEKNIKNGIKISSEKYLDDLEEFKEYCRNNNKNPDIFLAEIHKKIGVSKEDFMYFGPKTINYLKKEIYQKSEVKEQEVKEQVKVNKEIILSSEKYSDDLNEFKEYCRNKNKNPDSFLAEIHNKMKVSKEDFMYFGPKTINYLKSNIYDYNVEYKKQNDLINKFLNSLEKEKNKHITLNISSYLNKINNYINNNNDNLSLKLQKVKVHLEDLQKKGLKNFKVYSSGIYGNDKEILKKYFNKDIIKFGKKEWVNIDGTYITKGLDKEAENCTKLNGKSKNNDAYIVKQNGKYRLYFFKDGELKVASYVSPGKKSGDGGGYGLTNKGTFVINQPEINHISNSFRGLQVKNGVVVGWSMLNSRRINGAQHLHISENVTGNRESHGCVRIPSFYSIALGEYKNFKLHILNN